MKRYNGLIIKRVEREELYIIFIKDKKKRNKINHIKNMNHMKTSCLRKLKTPLNFLNIHIDLVITEMLLLQMLRKTLIYKMFPTMMISYTHNSVIHGLITRLKTIKII